MPALIKTSNAGTTNFNVVLNNTPYNIRTYWQPVASMWYLDLLASDTTPIAMGLALVPDINILRASRTLTQTFGELRVIDSSGDGNATEDSLGNTSQLWYFTPGEFDAAYPDYQKQLYRDLQFDLDELFTVI